MSYYSSTAPKRHVLHRLFVVATLFVPVTIVGWTGGRDVSADERHPVERFGRWSGFGWGDGYQACEKSAGTIGADLPPRTYAATFGDRPTATCTATGHVQTRRPSTFYDRFDASNGSSCDELAYDNAVRNDGSSEWSSESPIIPDAPTPTDCETPSILDQTPVVFEFSRLPNPIVFVHPDEPKKSPPADAARVVHTEPAPRLLPSRLPAVMRHAEPKVASKTHFPAIRTPAVQLTSGEQRILPIKNTPFFK